MRRVFFRGLALLLVFFVLGISASAAQQGSLCVYPMYGDKLIPGGTVTVYRIGEPVDGGFRLTGRLSHNVIPIQDAFSKEFLNWILARIPVPGIDRKVDQLEGAVFEGLTEGLYLVKQKEPAQGYMKFEPFVIGIPLGDQWDAAAHPKLRPEGSTPETGDDFSLVIGLAGMIFSALGLAAMEWKRNHR